MGMRAPRDATGLEAVVGMVGEPTLTKDEAMVMLLVRRSAGDGAGVRITVGCGMTIRLHSHGHKRGSPEHV